MKTSLDIPEELYREIKVKAAREGRKVSDVVADGLRLALAKTPSTKHRLSFPLIRATSGSRVITDEDVRRATDQLDDEEAAYYASFMRR